MNKDIIKCVGTIFRYVMPIIDPCDKQCSMKCVLN